MRDLRQPLKERLNGEWTEGERQLFNLISKLTTPEQFIFSRRLRICQAMLDTCDAEVSVIQAEDGENSLLNRACDATLIPRPSDQGPYRCELPMGHVGPHSTHSRTGEEKF